MRRTDERVLPADLELALVSGTPLLWINDSWLPLAMARRQLQLGLDDLRAAEVRLQRFAPLLAALFPELAPSGGIIESPLHEAANLRHCLAGADNRAGRWLIKADHALPVAGSVKARGGIYEVLVHAEELAIRSGLLEQSDDRRLLASAAARVLFAQHEVAVGSTGNLGLSIGITAAALGFRATVHMSADAKPWKKARLRTCGVCVIEHEGDYGGAVAAGRAQALAQANAYFVDDENSQQLFVGYGVGAIRLQQQLAALGIAVDDEHPLFVYLPCGVGGAPGGITFGLRQLFGDAVHCLLAEPVASPCMLMRLASLQDRPIAVTDIGLDNRTEADGLAVGQASEFVAPMMKRLAAGVFTVADSELFAHLYLLEQSEALAVEPSAAAGLGGPIRLLRSQAGLAYLERRGLLAHLSRATHVMWTTGGALVPREEYRAFHERGRAAWNARQGGFMAGERA